MAKLVLRPAHLRDDRFVVETAEEPVELDWVQAVERLAPSRTPQALNMLRIARRGWFIGTRKHGKTIRNFVLDAAGKANSIADVIRRQPSFESDLVEVFYVERIEWDAQMQETG